MHIPGPDVCNGIGFPYDSHFRECCSSSKPCGINQGDCDRDTDCSGSLVCGSNNCPSPFPSNADCCERTGTTTTAQPGTLNLLKS